MTSLAPVSVALKFGFLVILYLFVLWVARSARRDLRAGAPVATDRRAGQSSSEAASQPIPADATGFYSASSLGSAGVVNGRGVRDVQVLQPGDRIELGSTAIVFEIG